MNMLEQKLTEIVNRLDALEKKVGERTDSINGQPVINAYKGATFDLNGNLDVLALEKRVKNLENIGR